MRRLNVHGFVTNYLRLPFAQASYENHVNARLKGRQEQELCLDVALKTVENEGYLPDKRAKNAGIDCVHSVDNRAISLGCRQNPPERGNSFL